MPGRFKSPVIHLLQERPRRALRCIRIAPDQQCRAGDGAGHGSRDLGMGLVIRGQAIKHPVAHARELWNVLQPIDNIDRQPLAICQHIDRRQA
jgi:hypothetical protein